MLVVARFVTGLSAAFMTPVGLSIITTSFAEARARNQALSTAFQFGAAIGLAIVAAVVAAATDAGGDPQATLDGYRIGLLVPVAGALPALAITLPGLRSTFAAGVTRRIMCTSGRMRRSTPDFVHPIV